MQRLIDTLMVCYGRSAMKKHWRRGTGAGAGRALLYGSHIVKMGYALFAMSLVTQVPAVAQTSSDEDEIVVIAQKLDKLKISYRGRKKDGIIVVRKCGIKRSSGDAGVDAIGCQAVNYCVDQRLSKSSEFNKCVNDRAKMMGNELLDRLRNE